MEKSAGLLITCNNKILLIHPTGNAWYYTYGIPKGWINPLESTYHAALRETEEELGIKLKEYNIIISKDEHWIEYKSYKSDRVYKKVCYFLAYLDENDMERFVNNFKLQLEEVDWAGFLSKEEAEKKVMFKQREILNYIT